MDVDFDFSDVDSFFDEGEWEVEKKMIDVGDEAVKYAEEHGDYQDHTLTLRTSNDYDVNKDGLTLKNEAEYASFVESKGYDVLSSAALFAEKRLKEGNQPGTHERGITGSGTSGAAPDGFRPRHCHGSKHRPPAVQRDGTGVEQGDGACHPRQPFFRLRVGGQGMPLSDHNQRRG